MANAYQDELPHGLTGTVRVLGRAESLAALGMTEATADPDLFRDDLEPAFLRSGPARPFAPGAGPRFKAAPLPRIPKTAVPIVPQLVDIYLSAGPNAADGRSCLRGNYSGCSLWRIRLELATKQVLDVEELQSTSPVGVCLGGKSHLQPAVSPNGERYAWQETCVDMLGAGDSQSIVEQAVAQEGLDYPKTVVGPSVPRPMYPNWFNDHTVIFTADNLGVPGQTLSSATDWATTATLVSQLGPTALRRTQMSWSDAHTSATPADANVAGRPRVVTFGGPIVGAGSILLPRVTDLQGANESRFDIPQVEWQLDSSDPPQCHHPAWNPDGTKILCTRYQGPEPIDGETQAGGALATYPVRRLFQFEWDGTEWVRFEGDSLGVAGAMVEALTGPEFNLISRRTDGTALDLFPPRLDEHAGSGGCGAYVWKFAEWCASERYLVATVYCTDSTTEEAGVPLASRVVLIDTEHSDSHQGYTDLVTLIEYHLAAGADTYLGTYNGVFSTCTSVSPDITPAGLEV